MVGTSVGAKLGILIKGGPAFETAHKITTVIFDKTGTLTVGCPEVTDFIGCDESNFSKQEVLRIAASAEQGSEHPLAAAVLRAADAQNIELCPISDSKAIPGKGVECCLEYGHALVGNRGLFESSKIVINPVIDSYMWDIEIQGKTAICVCIDGKIIGVMGIADIPKAESKETIQVLRGMGIDCWMVTGDNKVTAEAIAEALDIPKDRVAAGMLPADKLEKVKELQGRGSVCRGGWRRNK
jgi:P-type Cu+ transporter